MTREQFERFEATDAPWRPRCSNSIVFDRLLPYSETRAATNRKGPPDGPPLADFCAIYTVSSDRSEHRKSTDQWNESPHAHDPVAFGLSIVNPCFWMVSSKSTVAPSRYGTLILSTMTST